jgi:hypothetical protein
VLAVYFTSVENDPWSADSVLGLANAITGADSVLKS